MKKLLLNMIALLALTVTSCEKQEVESTPLASLQITNAVIGGAALQFGTYAATVTNNATIPYSVLTGSQLVKLVSTDAPNTVYYNQTSDFAIGGVYSLFLTGTPGAVEPVMIKEESIVPHTDNVFGVRIINLSPNNVPISVNLLDSANGSLFSSVAYKNIADFKEVSAIEEEGDKTIEFRNAETGDMITSFVIPDYDMPRFRNITLVFTGAVGSEIVFRANNY